VPYDFLAPLPPRGAGGPRVRLCGTHLRRPRPVRTLFPGVAPAFLGGRYEDVWPGIFRHMFQPSPAMGETIDAFARERGMVPGEYTAAQIRARFPSAGRNAGIQMVRKAELVDMQHNDTRMVVHKIADNAANCAFRAMPDSKHIYIAADTWETIEYLMHESPLWANDHSVRAGNNVTNSSDADRRHRPPAEIVARPDYQVPVLHFNKVSNLDGSEGRAPPEAYFSTFFDLWMLAHSKCMSQGVGGYGHFGSMLSGNHHSCRNRHRNYRESYDSCPTPMELKIGKLETQVKQFTNDTVSKVVEMTQTPENHTAMDGQKFRKKTKGKLADIAEQRKTIADLVKANKQELKASEAESMIAVDKMLEVVDRLLDSNRGQ